VRLAWDVKLPKLEQMEAKKIAIAEVVPEGELVAAGD